MSTEITKAFAYARYSSDRQREASIEAQLIYIEEYAKKNSIEIIESYIDRAFTAKSDKRPAFQRMIADAGHGGVDLILVHKNDRFARNEYDHAIYRKMLKEHGVRVVAVAEDFGTGKEAILINGMLRSLSEYYIVNLAEEVRKGHLVNANNAVLNGGYAPFGYNTENQTLVINENEAAYVRRMYQNCLNGHSHKELLAEMNANGITGKRGKPMRYSSVYEILRNEKYTGTYVYCPNKENQKKRDKSDAIRIHGAFDAIIDRPTWEEVQKIMNSRKNAGYARSAHILSGKVFCTCGAKMHVMSTTNKGHTYDYFVCSAKCGNPNIRIDLVDDQVLAYMRDILSPEVKAGMKEIYERYRKQLKADERQSSALLQKEIDQKQKIIDNYIDSIGKSSLPADVINNIGEKISAVKREIDLLRAKKNIVTDTNMPSVDEYLNFLGEINDMNDPCTQTAVREFIESVTISKTDVSVVSSLASVSYILGRGDRIPTPIIILLGKSYPRK